MLMFFDSARAYGEANHVALLVLYGYDAVRQGKVWIAGPAYNISETGKFSIFVPFGQGLNQTEVPRSEHQELIVTGHKAGAVPAEVSAAPFELAVGKIKTMHMADDHIDAAFMNHWTAPF
jgi:hypothetical protein